MADKKIIAVVGATGAQGGGLVRAIVRDKGGAFQVRALTRDINAEKAQALAKLGVQLVAADLDDIESLKRAFEGAYGAFALTNYWEHFSPEKELAQAKAQARAAKDVGLQHVIWSTLEDTRQFMPADDKRMPMLQEKYRVPHFDAKAEADAFFSGVPTTFLLTTFYWDNLYMFGLAPKRGDDGKYSWAFPMGQKLASNIGIPAPYYHAAEADEYRGYGFPGADEMGNMFQYYRDFDKEFFALRDLNTAKALNPALQSFDQFLAKNKDKVKAATEPAQTPA